jgi:hypothetical protein
MPTQKMGKAILAISILLMITVNIGISAATVVIAPAIKQVLPSDSFSLEVRIDSVLNLHAASVKFTFDNTIIQYTGVTQGNFLTSAGDPTFFSSFPSPGASVTTVTADQAILGLGKVSGAGVLLTINFTALQSGISAVNLALVDLRDTDNVHIAFTPVNGEVIVNGSGVNFLHMDNISILEGDSGISDAICSVRLLPASLDTVAVRYRTLSGSATTGVDFIADSGQMVFLPGDTLKSLTVQIIADTVYEPNESFYIALSDPENASLADSQGTGVIMNDDPVNYTVIDKWNIVSVPVTVSDYHLAAVFPAAVSPAYSYQAGYIQEDVLVNGRGYWVKFGGGKVIILPGTTRNEDTISVESGWNMIGSISSPVPVTTIGVNVENLTASSFFKYTSKGYSVADTIQPGEGYWVKASQVGKLFLSATPIRNLKSRIRIVPISELPPSPPLGESRINKVGKEFRLEPNYPNPFNPATTVRYIRPDAGTTAIKIISMLGTEVFSIVRMNESEGEHVFTWDGHDNTGLSLPSGAYVLQVATATSAAFSKMLLLK